MTDWQPKPGQRVRVAFDAVIDYDPRDGTIRVKGDDDDITFAYVWPEHMERLPDPEPAWWPPQPGDIGLRDGGTWAVTPGGEVKLMTPDGVVTGWLTSRAPLDTSDRSVSDLLNQHPTLVIRNGKPWTPDA